MPFPYRCLSRKCKESLMSAEIQFLEETERGTPVSGSSCKNCDKTNKFVRLNVIHLLVPAQDGEPYQVKGTYADHNWKFACPKATITYKEGTKEMLYSVAPEACTCYDCKQAVKNGDVVLEYAEE